MKKIKNHAAAVDKPIVLLTAPSSTAIKSWLMISCGLLAFLLYTNTLSHGYVSDDEMAIVKNSYTHEGISALPKIFSTAYRDGFSDRNEGLYRPLSIALFAIEWSIAPGNPHLGHWGNVLLYVLTALMLFIMLTYFFENKNILIPFTATLLFVAHPVHTEVVANIKSTDELLCLLFSLISLWAIVKFARQNRLIYSVVAGIAIFLAMLSKETAVTMVVVAPLTVYFFSKSDVRKIMMSMLPFLSAFVIYLIIRISVLKGLSNFEEIQIINNSLVGAGDDTFLRLATAITIIGRYLWLLIFPHPLIFDYSFATIPLVSFSDPKALLSFSIIIALAVLAIKRLKAKDPVSWSILFLGATLSLVANILFLIEATLGERFLYMPSIGFSVALTFFLCRIFKVNQQFTPYQNISGFITVNKRILAIVMIVITFYSFKTISRNSDWKDNFTLTKVDAQTNPNSVRIRYAYGSILVMEKGLTEKDVNNKKNLLTEGIRQLTEAVKILPDYGDAWFNLGMGYKELEDYKSAITCFENARKFITTKDANFYIALGVVYGEDGQYEKAFGELNKAIELDPTSSEAYNNSGLFYSRAGNYPMSIQLLNKAMELDQKDDLAPYNMGNTYASMGDFTKAIEYYKKALALNPNSDIAMVNLGNSYGAIKDYPNALKSFEKALAINPSNQNAQYNLGTTYYLMGDSVAAKRYLPKQ